jgi:ABC-type branched-subunit amino acid transport system substrate-binding protein
MSVRDLTHFPEPEEKKEEKMVNKRFTRRDFLRTTALTGAGLVAASCAPKATETPAIPEKDKIVVGMSRPLTGWNATIGDAAFRPIYETWVDEVNADGGIYVEEYGKKLPIELLIYDDKSDLGTMTRLTEKLIVEDKVDFLWPASGTAFLFAQAPIANKYEYILITAEGGATSLKDMLPSLPYVFVTLSFSDWYQIPVLAELFASKGAKTAYITYIADLHGIEYSGVAGIEFPKVGIDVLGVKSLPPDIKDLSPIIKDADASRCFLLFCLSRSSHACHRNIDRAWLQPQGLDRRPWSQFRVLPHSLWPDGRGSPGFHFLQPEAVS